MFKKKLLSGVTLSIFLLAPIVNVEAAMTKSSSRIETVKPFFGSSPSVEGFAEITLFNINTACYEPVALYNKVYSNPYAKSKAEEYESSLR